MKPFMDADFLLENDVAKKLYHEYAEHMPIYDYHCHISPRMIAENHRFANIGELMLGGDHYKWRVMLSNGVDDRLCRGDASWHDKWLAFAASLKYCIGNPMYHWTHLELRRVFGIEDILSEKTAEDIWNRANEMLARDEFRCRGLIEKFGVTVRASQFFLFAFLFASALGILLGGPIGDKVGRKYVIWGSILGAAPFSLIMPHANLLWTAVLSVIIGLVLSSAFSAILVYAQELLPSKLGLISGLFFGLAFGIAGIASAVLGGLADKFGIEYVYQLCAYMPLLGLIAWFLPDIRKAKK